VWLAEQVGITSVTKWDMAETKSGGPFPTLVSGQDVLVNAIYLSDKIPPLDARGGAV
jgi:saccharopine dehydrogenase (NAD+, L-lysine forming)